MLPPASGGTDFWNIPVDNPNAEAMYDATKDYELRSAISPDGHWLASAVDSGGKLGVRIQSYPKPGARFARLRCA